LFNTVSSETSAVQIELNNEPINSTLNKSSDVKKSIPKFVFNPNTISLNEALKLGLSKKTGNILLHFREKGGKFYKPEDLKKLYGMTPEAYILIPDTKPKTEKDSAQLEIPVKKFAEKSKYEKQLIDINTADSLSIVYLKGIGPSFTKRIIKYRTLLGGFHSVNQLKEVYGMTDSLFINLSAQIQLNKNNITKLPINVIDFNTLRKHPYFNFQTAQAIINYRFKHGKLSEQDMLDFGIFSPEKLALILPYLSY
jgi:DNA uptake protein ComE-like DNA-binding protein